MTTEMNRLETLLRFHAEDPRDPFTRFAIASEYRKMGDSERALGFFEALAHDEPDYLGTYYHLGKLYEELNRPEDAVTIYRRGVDAANRQRDAHARAELQDALMQAQGIGFE